MQNAERLKSCQPVDKLLAEQSVAWWLNLKWSVEPPTVGGSWLDNYPVEKHWSQGDVHLQRVKNGPWRSHLTIPGTSRSDVSGMFPSNVLETS